MSGPMPQVLADKAQGIAFAAEAKAYGVSPRELAMLRARAAILDAQDARKKAGAMTAPERWWADAPKRVRVLLLNLGSRTEGDNFARAAMPWAAFSPADQASVAAVAAELQRGLVGADCLGW